MGGQKGASIPKDRFPHLLKQLMQEIEPNQEKNIQSGFRKSGIFPLNREKVLSRLPEEEHDEDDENAAVASNNSVVNLLKTMGYGDGNTIERKRRKKIDIQAGKSVGGAEFSESSGSEVEMSLHDSDGSIGPEDFREQEEEIEELYQMPCEDGSEEDRAEEDENGEVEEEDGESTNTVRKHGVRNHGRFFNGVFLVQKQEIDLSMWLLVSFEIQSSSKKKKYKYFIGQVTQ